MHLSAVQSRFLGWLASGEADDAAALPLVRAEGLAVYQNNYRGSLMACLADSFPQTLRWLGEGAFEAAAARYIDRMPPSSWTLDDYADGFPTSLALDYPDDVEVSDLARLELTLGQVFVAADAPALMPDQLASVDWETARLLAVPALAVVELRSNADAIWAALSEDAAPPPAQSGDAPHHVVIWRRDFLCRLAALGAVEAALFAHVVDGGVGFANLCGHAIALEGEETGIARAGQCLAQWAGAGMVRAIG